MNILTFITAPVPPVSDQQMNLWDMIVKGGWLMIPIFILSIIAVYIICERFTVIRKASVSPKVFTEKVFSYLQNGNKTAALQECDTEDSPVSRMIKKGIHYSHIPTTELRITMENTANKEIAALEKGLPALATIAGMAPMIGFLGTVVGMVQAFYDMSLAGNNINITLLSRGIYTAMITTVAGLIVGIIAYLAYNALVSRIDRIAADMENASAEFIDSQYETQNRK